MAKLRLFCLLLAVSSLGSALTCTPSAVPPTLHLEGLAERLGDILLTCSDGPPGTFGGNLNITLNVNVTNKLTAQGNADAVLTIDSGSGPVAAGVPATVMANNQISFNGLSFTVPASGKLNLRISNLRGAVSQLPSAAFGQAVHATLSFTASSIGLTIADVIVGYPQRSLLASVISGIIPSDSGSSLPETLTFSNLLAAGTRFSSARFTLLITSNQAPVPF